MVVPLDPRPLPAVFRKIPSPCGPNTSSTLLNHLPFATFWIWGSCATNLRCSARGHSSYTSKGSVSAGAILLN